MRIFHGKIPKDRISNGTNCETTGMQSVRRGSARTKAAMAETYRENGQKKGVI